MNYKVTFYKNEMEMLTERKANFVNQLKKLSSKITNELFKQISGKGTGAEKIINQMKDMLERNQQTKSFHIKIPDFINPEISNMPNTGQMIPITIHLITKEDNGDLDPIYTEGVCGWRKFLNKIFITRVEVEVFFTKEIEDMERSKVLPLAINSIQSTLVHELQHSRDSENVEETEDREKSMSKHGTVKSLHYYLKPTEIRSHMNEIFKIINQNRYDTPERYMRNSYKHAKEVEDASNGEVKFDDEDKEFKRKLYRVLKQNQNNSNISKKAFNAMWKLISKSCLRKQGDNMKKFIRDYHIAFVRDYNNITKERYYDVLFKGIDVPSLDQMNNFFEEIKTIYRSIIRLKNEIEKRLKAKYEWSDEDRAMVREFNGISNGGFWDEDDFDNIFIDYNPKKLKQLGKQFIENFRENYGFMTKGMMTRASKARTKKMSKELGFDVDGMEDFFSS